MPILITYEIFPQTILPTLVKIIATDWFQANEFKMWLIRSKKIFSSPILENRARKFGRFADTQNYAWRVFAGSHPQSEWAWIEIKEQEKIRNATSWIPILLPFWKTPRGAHQSVLRRDIPYFEMKFAAIKGSWLD